MRRAVAAIAFAAGLIWATLPLATELAGSSQAWSQAATLASDLRREQREGAKRVAAGFPAPNIAGLQAELEATLAAAIAQHGYPRAATSGQANTDAFWAALDECRLDFRRAQLVRLEALFEANLLDGPRLAQFIDTLLVEQGKPQRLATVVIHQAEALVLAPVEARETVDERRQRYGLLPLAQYQALLEKLHHKRFAPRVAASSDHSPSPAQAK